jgi:AAA15 family ATPase/GTPase
MFKALITEFPLSDVPKERTVTEEKIRKYTYTKEEVDVLISNAVKEAVEEAKRIDEESMAKHNRDATVISMILGFTTLALFVDGLLRMLGIIPPFMDLNVNILDKIETDIIDKVKQVPIQKILQSGFR